MSNHLPDPDDSSRPDQLGNDLANSPKKPPEQGRQEESAVEAFSEEGAGIAAKE